MLLAVWINKDYNYSIQYSRMTRLAFIKHPYYIEEAIWLESRKGWTSEPLTITINSQTREPSGLQ